MIKKITTRRRGPLPKKNTVAARSNTNGKPQRKSSESKRIKHAASGIDPPECLSKAGKLKWCELAPALSDQGLLETVDRDALALYCNTHAAYWECSAQVDRDGRTIVSATGVVKTHPLVSNMASMATTILKLQLEFGMTPAARSRVTIDEQETEDTTVADILGE